MRRCVCVVGKLVKLSVKVVAFRAGVKRRRAKAFCLLLKSFRAGGKAVALMPETVVVEAKVPSEREEE